MMSTKKPVFQLKTLVKLIETNDFSCSFSVDGVCMVEWTSMTKATVTFVKINERNGKSWHGVALQYLPNTISTKGTILNILRPLLEENPNAIVLAWGKSTYLPVAELSISPLLFAGYSTVEETQFNTMISISDFILRANGKNIQDVDALLTFGKGLIDYCYASTEKIILNQLDGVWFTSEDFTKMYPGLKEIPEICFTVEKVPFVFKLWKGNKREINGVMSTVEVASEVDINPIIMMLN